MQDKVIIKLDNGKEDVYCEGIIDFYDEVTPIKVFKGPLPNPFVDVIRLRCLKMKDGKVASGMGDIYYNNEEAARYGVTIKFTPPISIK